MPVYQQLLDAGVPPEKAATALIRHIKFTGDTHLLSPELLPFLKEPLPVEVPAVDEDADPYSALDDPPTPHKSQQFSKHRILAHLLLFLAYGREEPIVRSRANLCGSMVRLYQKSGQPPKVPGGHGFRLILSRLRVGKHYGDLPRIDTTGPDPEGLVIIQPRLAKLDQILSIQWPEWLLKAERKAGNVA